MSSERGFFTSARACVGVIQTWLLMVTCAPGPEWTAVTLKDAVFADAPDTAPSGATLTSAPASAKPLIAPRILLPLLALVYGLAIAPVSPALQQRRAGLETRFEPSPPLLESR